MTTDTRSQPEDAAGERYDAAAANAIETKWQQRWEQRGSFITLNPGQPGFERFEGKAKQYILDMFPYPSGVGLHVGHPLGYIATDIYARYLRAKGYHVLHAMGYDAFGLPAEQFAVEHGVHPRITTERNIATMRAQLKRLGLAHDPTRSVSTTDVGFYRWTQWIFLQIYNSWYDADATNPAGTRGRARPISELIAEFESGQRALPGSDSGGWSQLNESQRDAIIDGYRLAYLAEVPVNWCPALGTVLANEEVTSDGRSERGNHPVYKRPMKQWMMRITACADRLLDDLEPLAWPESTKMMQRNWIGRSEGAYIDFAVDAPTRSPRSTNVGFGGESRETIRVFTTRPDTLFGATYMVLAPEHALVDALTADAWPAGTPDAWKDGGTGVSPVATPRDAVAAYRRFAESKSELQRQADAKEKTGVFIGAHAINPATGKPIPIFIADYVLMGYGTGAIMAVPAQDERDWVFARAFGLSIVRTVRPPADFGDEPFLGDGPAMNSDFLDGLRVADAKYKMIVWLEANKHGQGTTNYKLRDWLFSRQRYWGEPFPIVYDTDGHPIALPESALPVELPPLDDFTPAASDDPKAPPQPPLGRAKEWINVEIDGKTYRRELNTMPQWAGSCWYYLRYLDPNDEQCFVDPQIERYWMLSEKRSGGTGFQPVRDIAEGASRTNPDLQRTRRWLPHWTIDGSTYFITFRLRQGELGPEERQIVLDACVHWNGSRARVYVAVVMPDHVHLIVKPLRRESGGWWTLSELLQSIKGFSAREINKSRKAGGPVWQEESFDRIIRDESEFQEKWDYIRMNPVRKGLVSNPSEYEWLTEPAAADAGAGKTDSYRLKACTTEDFNPAIHHLGGVDLYVGGVEHAVLHLLYARFWHKTLFDLGHVSTPEPFGRLFNQGYIQAFAYTDERGVYIPAEQVQERDGQYFYNDKPVNRSYGKMGKSLKNALTPDDIFAEYGCDTLRLYEMYMGPLDQSKPWNTRDIIGSHRFLQRIWRNFIDAETNRWKVVETPLADDLRRVMHKTIAKVDEDMRSMRFNTAIAALIEFNNALVAMENLPREAAEALVKMLAPFVPHLAAELWERLGHDSDVMYEPFPVAEAGWLVDEQIEIPVQIMGKLRATVTVPNGADEAAARAAAMANERIAELLEGKTIRKVIYVPNRLLNFVAN